MPATGRAACSAPQTATRRTADHKTTKGDRHAPSPRRESSAAVAVHRPGPKNRAYSAPHGHGLADSTAASQLASDLPEDDEIVVDPFFQRYNFPQPQGLRHEASKGSSSSLDGSSDTEGPLSPTNVKGRPPFADAFPSPRSPAPSVGVCHASVASLLC